VSVKVITDTTETKKLLEKIQKAESQILSKFIFEGGELVKSEMRFFVPEKTGFLQRSIIFRESEKAKGRFFVVPRAIYAKKIERKYGFVTLAFLSAKDKLISLIKKLVGEIYGKP